MSEENVEILREAIDAFNRGDGDTWIEYFDPEIEWHDVPSLPGGGVHRGQAALRRHFDDFSDTWGEVSTSIHEIESIDDQVVARHRWVAVGKESRIPVEIPETGAIYEFRQGRIFRVLQFVTHDEALEATGLSK